MALVRQHLIDPEICIRCNTCEETCPINAISNDGTNYVVDASICDYSMECISPCPTGAIDNWRMVETAYGLDDQFGWDELPAADAAVEAAAEIDEDAARILDTATQNRPGASVPLFSAAHPYVNVYTKDRPATAAVTGNVRITGDGAASDIRHIILDFGTQAFPVLEGQSIGVIPPGTDGAGKPHHMRLYSVASPRDGERPNHNNLALTVKRVAGGVASNFMCDLQRGDKIEITGPYGEAFLMPNHPGSNIIMICTGTGAAPFRAMTEYRRRNMRNDPGQLMLFFGARTPDELPYFGPLAKLPDSFIDKQLVFSRLADKPKEYVQDRIRARADAVAELLRSEHTFIFVCGLKGMETGVDEALNDVCRQHGLDWADLRPAMEQAGRLHIETY